MIANIQELAEFTRRLGDKIPHLRDGIALKQPGYSQEAINGTAAKFPEMPESYWSLVRTLKLDGVAIGFFQLSPQAYEGVNLLEKLSRCNTSTNPFHNTNQHYGLYQVASWEADPICVAFRDGPFKKGQIVKYNVGNPNALPDVLADSFEQFLLLAGNLDAVRDAYSEADNPSQGLNEFKGCFEKLLPASQQQTIKVWEAIAGVVLS